MYELDTRRVRDSLQRIDPYLNGPNGFREKYLTCKKDREERGWKLLSGLRAERDYSRQAIEKVIDRISWHFWFGEVFGKPNVNRMFEPDQNIGRWLETLLDESKDLNQRLITCLGIERVKGTRTGALTVFLYLSNPKRYNVWTPRTQSGLQEVVADNLPSISGKKYDRNYQLFNSLVTQLRDTCGFEPQEMDWVLWAIWTERYNPEGIYPYSQP